LPPPPRQRPASAGYPGPVETVSGQETEPLVVFKTASRVSIVADDEQAIPPAAEQQP
jgi:hypothetical protein